MLILTPEAERLGMRCCDQGKKRVEVSRGGCIAQVAGAFISQTHPNAIVVLAQDADRELMHKVTSAESPEQQARVRVVEPPQHPRHSPADHRDRAGGDVHQQPSIRLPLLDVPLRHVVAEVLGQDVAEHSDRRENEHDDALGPSQLEAA